MLHFCSKSLLLNGQHIPTGLLEGLVAQVADPELGALEATVDAVDAPAQQKAHVKSKCGFATKWDEHRLTVATWAATGAAVVPATPFRSLALRGAAAPLLTAPLTCIDRNKLRI